MRQRALTLEMLKPSDVNRDTNRSSKRSEIATGDAARIPPRAAIKFSATVFYFYTWAIDRSDWIGSRKTEGKHVKTTSHCS